MSASQFDPSLVSSWLAARSVCRGLPMPSPDRGGFRVDTNLPQETRRWVFPQICDGMTEVAREITAPRHLIKLCGTENELKASLPSDWQILPQSYFMMANGARPPARPLPAGYSLQCDQSGQFTIARIIAPNDDLAANGYAAEAEGVFIYDRIETAPEHRRRGLGNVIMHALKDYRVDENAPELLVATEDGHSLYRSLGWRVLSPYTTAAIPG